MQLRFTGLWRNPDFVKLWAGQTVATFGALLGAVNYTAILVLDATPFQVSMLSAARVAPGLAFGLVAGAWVDRLRRRPILIGADVGRAVLLGSVPAAYFMGILSIEQLYVVAFVGGTLTIFFEVAYPSYLPSLIHRKELIEANSKLQASSSTVEVVSFGVGGWIVQLFTAIVAAGVNALTYLLSAFWIATIRAPEPPPAPRAERQSIRREIVEGLKLVWSQPYLRAIGGSTAALGISMGVIGALYSVYGIRELGIQPGLLGMIAAVGGVTSVVGALLTGRATRRFGLGPVTVFGMALIGLGSLFIPLARGPLAVAVMLLIAQQLVVDGAWTAYMINQMSLRQAITPDRSLGRVNGGMQLIELAVTLAGSLLAGALSGPIGLRWTLVIGACGGLLGALWLALSPVRKVKEPPAPSAESSHVSQQG